MNAREPRAAALTPTLARADHLAVAVDAAAPAVVITPEGCGGIKSEEAFGVPTIGLGALPMNGSSPPNDEGAGARDADPFQSTQKPNQESVATEPIDDKRFANIRAELAFRGYCLSALSDGSMLVHKWNLSRPLPDLRAAATFLRQIGGVA